MTTQGGTLSSVDEFWYKLKVDADEVKKVPGDQLTNLVKEFLKGKKSHVQKIVGDPTSFLKQAPQMPSKQLASALLNIYGSYLWDSNRSGVLFVLQDGSDANNSLQTAFSELTEKGSVLEAIGEGFYLMWIVEPKIVEEKEKEQVVGRKYLAAYPCLIKVQGPSFVELRGKSKNVGIVKDALLEKTTFQEQTLAREDRPLSVRFSQAFEKSNPLFDIIGIRYLETNLPNKSGLSLRNERGVEPDINEMGKSKLVVPWAATDIGRITLRIKTVGKVITLKVLQHDEGFSFQLDDKRIPQVERESLKKLLSSAFDISFEKIYPYEANKDTRFLFHKMIAGNVLVYEKYFDLMDPITKHLLASVTKLIRTVVKTCSNCGKEFESGNSCPICDSDDIEDKVRSEVETDPDALFNLISEQLKASLHSNPSDALLNTRLADYLTGGKEVVLLNFDKVVAAGTQPFTRHFEFWICPLGYGKVPERIDDYLVDCVVVAYGDAYLRRNLYREFAIIDVFQLLTEQKDRVAAMLEQSLDAANRLNEDRLIQVSTESERELALLQSSGIPSGYTPKDFERDVFYLLKRMFPHSERWGREGSRESDGIIIVPQENGNYFLASYDPKLTRKSTGYDLDSEQQNKAAYYILNENAIDRISLLTSGKGVAVHVIISNSFNSSTKSFADGVVKWFRLSGTEGTAVPIIFLALQELLELYHAFADNWELVKANPEFYSKFLDHVVGLFRTNERSLRVDSGHLKELGEFVNNLKRTVRHTQPLFLDRN